MDPPQGWKAAENPAKKGEAALFAELSRDGGPL